MISQQVVPERDDTRMQVATVVVKIEDGEDKHNQGGDQPIQWEEQFLLIADKSERRAHPAKIDRCTFV